MRLALVLSLLVSLAGCSKQKSEPSPPADKAPATENAPAERASAAPPAPEPPELPTEGDFEEEAEKITGANLERELDQLERELIGR